MLFKYKPRDNIWKIYLGRSVITFLSLPWAKEGSTPNAEYFHEFHESFKLDASLQALIFMQHTVAAGYKRILRAPVFSKPTAL